MPEQEIRDLLHQHFGKEPQAFDETHLPLDTPLPYLRLLLPTENQVPIYLMDGDHLVGLNISGLDLTSDHLQALTHDAYSRLKALNISGNNIDQWTVPPKLEQLAYLESSDNPKLTQLHFPQALKHLKRLDVSNCALTSFELGEGFEELEFLDIGRNKGLTSFSFKEEFPALKYVYLPACSLTELRIEKSLPELAYLFANDNELHTFSLGENTSFPKMEAIELKNNLIKEVGPNLLAPFPHIEQFTLTDNPLPEAVLSNIGNSPKDDLAFLKSYTAELLEGEVKNNECKILLLGNGGVGKSCFLSQLVHKKFNYKWESTHGIVIEERYEGDDTTKGFVQPYTYNIWDFAGQSIYHATHRLFMQANAIYLVMWDKETEESPFSVLHEAGKDREYENYSLEYWLHYAEKRGNGRSPAIVVQTKRERDGVIDLPKVRQTYDSSFLTDFRAIESSKEDIYENGFFDLLAAVRKAVQKIKEQEQIPKSWDKIRKEVNKLKEAGKKWLSFQEFKELAKDYDGDPIHILRWLTQSGTVFYQEEKFKDIILDQFWAIEAIYALFDRKKTIFEIIEKRKGLITGAYLETDVWKAYQAPERELFISFLLSCEMCFETSKEKNLPFARRSFVAPQLLPAKTEAITEDFWAGREALYMEYKHDHFHYGIIQSFIVRMHYLSSDTGLGDSRDIWKMGIRLKDGNQWAQVEASEKLIEVRATKNAVGLLHKIHAELQDIRQEKGEAYVGHDKEGFVALSELEHKYASGSEYVVDTIGETRSIPQYLPFLPKERGMHQEQRSNYYPHGYALFIGIQYAHWKEKYPLAVLNGTLNDVEDLYSHFTDEHKAAYDPENIISITEANATPKNILKGFEKLAEKVKNDPDASVLIYYAGHGETDGKEFFMVPYDFDIDTWISKKTYSKDNVVMSQAIADGIAKIASKKTLVILDCCHSENIPVERGLEASQDFARGFQFVNHLESLLKQGSGGERNLSSTLSQGKGHVILTSCEADERSYEYTSDGRTNGLFTTILLECLNGTGNERQDGWVRLTDLITYMSPNVVKLAGKIGRKQTPIFKNIQDLGGGEHFTICAYDIQTARSVVNNSNEDGNTKINQQPIKSMDLESFKQELRDTIDNQGFLGASEVLEKISKSNFSFNKPTLANLRNELMEPGAKASPNSFLVALKAFISSLH